ncbi:alpha/beta hydrolase family protein [Parapedobacter koreensis]|uniref:Prolyl oligopeptidase family protein n=1 Tax=Parapedobacter koreensis TaxID=332977 RepID=A0A1H7TAI7_9SPHI|nr:prolyl oligopeptidase family serine peptidase [Parapedobacter koreensis]SEL81743.1 Prolyl oligopeptidase family protein [Parapedobacter koreensis]
MNTTISRKLCYALVLAYGLLLNPAFSQNNLTYQLPPESIRELLDAPTVPNVRFNSSGDKMLILSSPEYPSITHVAQPVLGIAGLRINPGTNSGTVAPTYTELTIRDVHTGADIPIKNMPEDLQAGNITWSPDEAFLAFTHTTAVGVELWLINIEEAAAKKLTDTYVNDAYGSTLEWDPQGKHILVQLIPDSRGEKPVPSQVPTGPIIQENLGGRATPSPTYQYLLSSPYDEVVMDYYLTSQLATVSPEGVITKMGEPKIFRSFSYSPDGQYTLVQTIERPYSYVKPIASFPFQSAIYDSSFKLVKTLYHSPLADNLPIGYDVTMSGPRSYGWRNDAAATLYWVEALDEGDPNKAVPKRDALYVLAAPFDATGKKLYETDLRYGGVQWGGDAYAVITEQWQKDRKIYKTLINPNTGNTIKRIMDRLSEDGYTDPGNFVLTKGENKKNVILFDKGKNPTVFTIGTGASPLGDRPFLMRWDLISGKQDTLFKSQAPYYEYPVYFNNEGTVYISREAVEEVPNYFLVDLKNRNHTAITDFSDPYPSLRGVTKQQLSYPRKDGIKLTATLYLPKGYKKEDGRLPVLIWAYPREFKTLDAAGQVKGSPYRFTTLAFRSPVFWVTRGYAILDNADMPIVGEGDQEPNDTFIQQIKDNAEAVINYVVDDLGIADRRRIGVGGHSYGAFMTANLLAHTDLFAAGLARSGAYNRTLTPFGFQSERRTYWQVPDVYYNMSPFSFADKIKTPILLTHGMDDENSGTFPIQSERLYAAIKGFGGTVRLVLLPREFHGYRARESVMHTFYEMDRWLETYVKNRK